MEIIDTFKIVEDCLYAVQYDTEDVNEFRRIFDLWRDAEYLEDFFETHKSDLRSGFWRTVSVVDAILQTRNEANKLEKELIEIAEDGKEDQYNTLSALFKPLHDHPTRLETFEKNKVTGEEKPSWLRIYAIRIEANLFLITGGAIKLTKTMNDRDHLLKELEKLDLVQKCLQDEENPDLPIFELIF